MLHPNTLCEVLEQQRIVCHPYGFGVRQCLRIPIISDLAVI
jgi:hypothetical protein